jgi:F420-dependent oxidoreductase-like protein
VVEVAIFVEGQNGLNWENWRRIARATEDLGFAGLYRSDHFTNMQPPDIDSLELWVSLAWLADHTSRIEFGPLVTPLSFRNPVFTARTAKDVDELSNGRLTLGLGAGWQEREHEMFGFDLLEPEPRFDRFEEGVEVVYRLLREPQPVSFTGQYSRLQDATLLPRPNRLGGPPILIGGQGWNRTLRLTAQFADEWNCGFRSAEVFARLNARLNTLLEQAGRQPTEVRRSLANTTIFGRDDRELRRKIEARGLTPDRLAQSGVIHGTGPQIVDQLGHYQAAGVQRVMLQWLELDDLDGLAALAEAVLA